MKKSEKGEQDKQNFLANAWNKHRSIFYIAFAVAFLLLIPLIAMQFTEEVDWEIGDFVVMGTLLCGTGLGINLATAKIRKPLYRIIACAAILMALFLIWAELAVGIFGTPFAGS